MKKRSLAAMAVTMLIAAASATTFVAPQMAYAQVSDAKVPAQSTIAPQTAGATADQAVPPPVPASTETVTNPYGLSALWNNGDFVARFVLMLLVIMSMGSWYIMITKFFEQYRANRRAKSADEQLWAAPSLAEGAKLLDESSPFRFIAETAIEAGEHHDEALLEAVDRNTWIDVSVERAITNVSNRLQDGLAFLGTVGSTAPFVGLFGTVWGIMNAFRGLSNVQQATLSAVAPGIAEALVATAIGLFAAIQAVLAYNRYATEMDRLANRFESFMEEFSNILQRQTR